jgi:N-methylhydantoinase B/oxoprolinase/acetone carboxylase alpha subunit
MLDMLDAVGEEEVQTLLSNFSCPINNEIEHYVKNNAIDFSRRKLSVTYLVLGENGYLKAIFALTHKAVQIMNANLSENTRKRIRRYAHLDEESDSYMISSFLIAQFGKNYFDFHEDNISGDELMNMTLGVLKAVQREIGGGVVYLECENKQKLLEFYLNEKNRFRIFGERVSKDDNVKYVQMMRFL